MSRRYSSDYYKKLIESIRIKDPTAGIGADVIVGFPGETDSKFEETYAFLVDLPISYMHVFTYSERPSTPAANALDKVEHAIRHNRNERLRILDTKKRHHFYSQFIGSSLPVLYETQDEYGKVGGLTSNYIRVKTVSNDFLTNKIILTTIDQVSGDYCEGVIMDHSLQTEAIKYSTINV